MACCTSAFSSATSNTPTCTVACLSTAEKGSTFIGADGSIWVLTGDDPCDVSSWKSQDCCIRFVNPTTGLTDRCCGDILTLISSNNSVVITVTEGQVDFTVQNPLPVANYSYTTGALSGTLDSPSSTSTQEGVTITRAWTATGPGTLTFSDPAGVSPTFTATVPGEYIVTLTVTDSNGNVSTYKETICVLAKDKCDTLFEVPAAAFADPLQPTDAEAVLHISNSGPYNNGTVFYYIGNGTVQNPDFIWMYVCSD